MRRPGRGRMEHRADPAKRAAEHTRWGPAHEVGGDKAVRGHGQLERRRSCFLGQGQVQRLGAWACRRHLCPASASRRRWPAASSVSTESASARAPGGGGGKTMRALAPLSQSPSGTGGCHLAGSVAQAASASDRARPSRKGHALAQARKARSGARLTGGPRSGPVAPGCRRGGPRRSDRSGRGLSVR